MAKKKKKGHPAKRRRVGAGGKMTQVVLRVAGVGLGAIAGAFVVNAGKTAFPTLPLWAPPVAVAAAGAVVPHFVKNNPLAEGFGDGMLAIGAVMALNETVLSVPGIAGLSMYSNAGPANNVLRSAVGRGPNAYLNSTVSGFPPGRIITGNARRAMAVGALVSD
jgi:hypothetical protein